MARRLPEAGVRFVEITHTGWDQHRTLTEDHAKNAAAVDAPIAGLLAGLGGRGLLKDALAIFAGRFGRTPAHRPKTAATATIPPTALGAPGAESSRATAMASPMHWVTKACSPPYRSTTGTPPFSTGPASPTPGPPFATQDATCASPRRRGMW